MMKIYIGFDYDDSPMGVLLADSEERAHITWNGMGDFPYSVEEIDPSKDLGIYGVAILLTSEKKKIGGFDGKIVRVFKRGN